MKLADVRPQTFKTAVRVYLEEAWGDARVEERWPTEVLDAETAEEILARFENETRRRGQEGLRRHVLRLGNPGYPHMKLAFQETLFPGEFFFTVDTHDEMDLKPTYPGYDEWLAQKARNRELKRAIEARWRMEPEVPTPSELRAMIKGKQAVEGGSRVLVVDDETDIAEAVAALLAGEGYTVEMAYDGPHALRKVEEFRPDLLVMDFHMPGLNGVEVCAELKEHPETRDIPIVLATASMVDLTVFGTLANGFLMKPYNRDFLVGFVKRLVPPAPSPSRK